MAGREFGWAVLFLLWTLARGGEVVRLAGEQVRVGVDSRSGALVELIDGRSGHNFAPGGAGAPSLWTLELVRDGRTVKVDAGMAGRFGYELGRGAGAGLRLRWAEFPADIAPGLEVEATVKIEAGGHTSRWEVAVHKQREWALTQLEFPRWNLGAAQPDEFLAVPAWMGERHRNPRVALAGTKGKVRRLAWEYPGRLSLQCLAYFRENGPGLYVACDDAAAFRKSMAVQGDGRGGVECEVGHLPEDGARDRERYAPAYGVQLGTFQGDWVTAAERYRGWAREQAWAKSSRLTAGAVPAWVTQTALWVWNRGRSEEVLGPAALLQRELGHPVSVLWHWWHGCAYDTGFPEYLPPREGAAPFRAAMDEAHARGLHAMVYMNQRLWGLTTASWREEGAERFAVKGADGTYRPEVYNTFTKQACVSMCLGTEFWRNKYAGLAEQTMRELAVDGIYMDQACSSLACFDATHGHPLGGGTYWMGGFRRLAADIRVRGRETRPVALAGEGTGEAWLPHLDLMLSLQVSRERYAPPADGVEPIPFFQAVYHAHGIQFGNYSSLTLPPYDELWPRESAPPNALHLLDRKYSRQFYLEQARAFVWGQQPMLANFRASHLQERPEEIAYVVRLARLRQVGLPFLLQGEFLRPPELEVPAVESDVSRLSIYVGQQGALTSYRRQIPLALAGAWRAPDGRVAVVLASVADTAQEVSLRLDRDAYRVGAAVRVVRSDENGRRRDAGTLAESGRLTVTLGPREACLLELVAP